MRVTLESEWELGQRLGGGGFGEVFEAKRQDGFAGVIKLVPKMPGAQRELLFEEVTSLPNVVPVLEVGETPESYAIAMPRAQCSLEDLLAQGPVDLDVATAVIRDVATALAALADHIVHRDVKPANVLLLNGKWCLADFGIARYAEASTSADTRKFAWSAPYAAPERWRGERASHATDIYSLGVMGYELLAQRLPFEGPDFRREHLEKEAPPLLHGPADLRALLTECLFKAAGARPTAANVLRRVERLGRPKGSGAAILQEANAAALKKIASQDAARSAGISNEERRSELLRAAGRSFGTIRQELRDAILEEAPSAGSDFPFRIGSARLSLPGPTPSKVGDFARPGYESAFEVICFSSIELLTGSERYQGRSHSLWFCDAQAEGEFRWFECAFSISALIPKSFPLVPAALPPDQRSLIALAPVLGEVNLAWPFTPIDQGDGDDFVERWLGWFGQAALGQLEHPRSVPERDGRGSFRPARVGPGHRPAWA